jgi:hypothetical protein
LESGRLQPFKQRFHAENLPELDAPSFAIVILSGGDGTGSYRSRPNRRLEYLYKTPAYASAISTVKKSRRSATTDD